MNADRGDDGKAAGPGAAALPSNAPRRGLAGPAGHDPGAAVSGGKVGTAAPDLPEKVIALIRREAHMFDAVGALIPRPPVDIRNRLSFFFKTAVSLDKINEVLRSGGRNPPETRGYTESAELMSEKCSKCGQWAHSSPCRRP
jgi:hypothetical protein